MLCPDVPSAVHNASMAERINAPDDITPMPSYPWDEWCDGSWWAASWGRDFTCSMTSFRALVYQAAKARNAKAETRVDREKRLVKFRVAQPETDRALKEMTV